MKKRKQVIPKWFNGAVYQEGTTVQNPFSGESCKLNALELSIYDFIMGANLVLEDAYDKKLEPNEKLGKITKDLYKGLDWFREHNAKAYMILLD
tara:strand:- start:81 stop:362 length:282 start_codon:yes stop_codon:yes gene_type:complete